MQEYINTSLNPVARTVRSLPQHPEPSAVELQERLNTANLRLEELRGELIKLRTELRMRNK